MTNKDDDDDDDDKVYDNTTVMICVKDNELESRHWGPAHPAVSEYKTYSESSQVKVYKDDQLITSTDNGVRTGTNL